MNHWIKHIQSSQMQVMQPLTKLTIRLNEGQFDTLISQSIAIALNSNL